VSIRDRQVAEKAERRRREREADRMLDLQVEVHRLERIKAERDKEHALRKWRQEQRK